MKKIYTILVTLAIVGLSLNMNAQITGNYEGSAHVTCTTVFTIDETFEGVAVTLSSSTPGYCLEIAEIELMDSVFLPSFQFCNVTATPNGTNYTLTAPSVNIIIPEVTIPPMPPYFPDGATLTDVPVTIALTNGLVAGKTLTLKITATAKLLGGLLSIPFTIDYNGTRLFEGHGTSTSPYLIYTPEELKTLADIVNAGNTSYNDKFYLLMNNLNLSAYQAGAGWIPIGNNDGDVTNKPFKGTFNGNDKIITGLKINNTTPKLVGLFGYVNGGNITNLGVENAVVVSAPASGHAIAGVIAGYLHQSSSISYCYSTGTLDVYVTSDKNAVAGGLIGHLYATGTISNCYSTVKVTCHGSGFSFSGAGGIVGNCGSSAVISTCYSTGEISSFSGFAGGITGDLTMGGTIYRCAALNPKITINGLTNYGRITGYMLGELASNIAFSDMINPNGETIWLNKGADQLDGEDITAAEVRADGSLGGRFKGGKGGWVTQNGYLPGLLGKLVDMPPHLGGVGIKPIPNDELQITVYPNPTTGQLTIENGQLTINGVELYDVMGKKQFSIFNFQFSIEKIDISHLSNGVYFLKITTETGIVTKKVIKN